MTGFGITCPRAPRHCTALAALSGATDLAQLLVDDEADALQVNG